METNKAATEQEVALLHSLITTIHKKKASAILKIVERAEALGEAGEELIAAVIDSRQIATMQKWVEYNGVRCSVADAEAETELAKRLKEIKDKQAQKVVKLFDDDEDEVATG